MKTDFPKMWELLQIKILRTNPKIVGTHTFRKILSSTEFIFFLV
ncbi:hypothetical protein LEP1GSC021_2960 [Leptospira noguchii str. 1993005606]|nr:hypothetical protein LEP1GSC021_2960 [Leptospira noguchii str. 1993005606]